MSGLIHYENKVIVLTYHHVGRSGPYSIPLIQFRSHLQALRNHGYQVIDIGTFLHFIHHGSVPANAVLLTFDDGWDDFYYHAFPELSAFQYPAVNFVIVSRMMKSGKLTWEQMREMQRSGILFFSHTFNQHYRVNGVPALLAPVYLADKRRMETQYEYKERMKQDFQRADAKLTEELGRHPHLLCFPYGAYNTTVILAAREARVELCFTIKRGINGRGQYEIYRLDAGSPTLTSSQLIGQMQRYH